MITLPKYDADGKPSGYTSIAPLFTYANSDATTREAIIVAAENHMDEVKTKALAAQFGLSTKAPVDVHHVLGEEILRLCGGKALVEDYKNLRADYVSKVQSAKLDSKDILGNLKQAGITINSDGTYDIAGELDRKLTTQNSDRGGSHAGGMLSSTVSLQLNCKFPTLWKAIGAFPEGMALQLGFRVSLVVSSVRKYWGFGKANDGPKKTYSITGASTDGLRFALTGTIGTIKVWGTSISIEATFNLSIKDGVWRINNFTFDPVIDTYGYGIARRLLRRIGGEYYNDKNFGPETVFCGNTIQKLQSPVHTWFIPGPDGVINDIIHNADYSGFTAEQVQAFVKGADEADNTLKYSASLKTVTHAEVSFFRFVLVNGQIADENGPFKSGFQGNLLWGWVPGLKGLNYFGVDFAIATTGSCFFRLFWTLEGALVFGSTDFEYAYGNVFQP
jgi:hypothetical protein